MPKEFHRSERVSELLHRMVSDVVRNEVHDPRVSLVTITDLQLSRDLTVAKIYFTSLDDEADLDEIATVLMKAAGFIRSRIGREIRLRTTPELRFFKDDVELRGRAMSALIDDAISKDDARRVDDESADENSDEQDGSKS
ncbi:MAG: 30S ribosome-binding factor RbfA [Gammaproteobacteria bacterium]